MCTLPGQISLTARSFALMSILLTAGCMHPGMYCGNPYAQPAYSPQVINNGAPGSLYIPETSAPPREPLGTYESDPPNDDFDRPNGRFFESDQDNSGGVPVPPDSSQDRFRNDLGGPTTQYSLPVDDAASPSSGIRQVSGISNEGEYGFDTNAYHWLRGVLRYDSGAGGWTVTYSLIARDTHSGNLTLSVSPNLMNGLVDGDTVDVHGRVDASALDQRGRPVYRVSSIDRIDL